VAAEVAEALTSRGSSPCAYPRGETHRGTQGSQTRLASTAAAAARVVREATAPMVSLLRPQNPY